jgi:hypothetical protein
VQQHWLQPLFMAFICIINSADDGKVFYPHHQLDGVMTPAAIASFK